MQSETRIDGPHGAVGMVSPRWFMGSLRGWWVVTPDPQPTISGARTDSEPVAKGNHAQTDFATPPDDPDMREAEVWDFEAARGATNEADRVCFDAAVAWSKSRKPHCSARYRIDMREAFRAGARWAKHREVTVRTGTLMDSNTADGGGRAG